VCFNNEPVVRLSIPSLTAVDVPSTRMGQVAADLLLRQMAAAAPAATAQADGDGAARRPPPAPQRVRLDESLIVRESTAPPGGRRAG
jgi:DNA-binding LacI/PurR family transcriptional regulator